MKSFKSYSSDLDIISQIKKDPWVIKSYSFNLSKKVQIVAVKKDPFTILSINKPYREVQLLVIISVNFNKLDFVTRKNLILNIPLFSKLKFQLDFIELKPSLIEFIKTPKIEVQELALKKDPSLLAKLPNKFGFKIKNKYKYLITPGKLGILNDIN